MVARIEARPMNMNAHLIGCSNILKWLIRCVLDRVVINEASECVTPAHTIAAVRVASLYDHDWILTAGRPTFVVIEDIEAIKMIECARCGTAIVRIYERTNIIVLHIQSSGSNWAYI